MPAFVVVFFFKALKICNKSNTFDSIHCRLSNQTLEVQVEVLNKKTFLKRISGKKFLDTFEFELNLLIVVVKYLSEIYFRVFEKVLFQQTELVFFFSCAAYFQ